VQHINLLPPEMRPRETTPVKIIVTLYIGVAVCFALLMWGLYLHFGVIPPVNEKISALGAQIKILEDDAKYHDTLQKEIQELEKKDKIVTAIKKERVTWARRLDMVWDVVSNSRTTWVGSLSVNEIAFKVKKRGSKKGLDTTLPVLTLDMYSSSFEKDAKILDMNSETLIGDFIEKYKSNEELMRGFEIIPPNIWTHSDKSWNDQQKMVVKYKLVMQAYPYNEDLGERKKFE